ncbi:hypothetical protein GCM10023185_02970 [Hymenobacter saemangeumensis]|uniref:Uncharacterized protein n=1 Tax=Hymenobacter saemangeumensis TaxID=1084522 RepID=A0ABP8HYP3_9BACT
MRFCLPLLLALAGLLTSCDTEPAPVRLDFVGATGLTSSNRTAGAADTLTTRVYASSEEPLRRLQVQVSYEPTANPINYPTPASSYDPKDTPDGPTLIYLDSVFTSGQKNVLFQSRFSARSTSGTERWIYSATDREGRTASRAFRITVRKSDSLAVYHSYTLVARPAANGPEGRRFLALRPGLLLPKYAVNTQPENQKLVDLVFAMRQNDISLETPDHSALALSTTRWPAANRRPTSIRRANLSRDAFQNADTRDKLRDAYNNSPAYTSANSTGPLAKDNVLAFATRDPGSSDTRYGLLIINDIIRTPVPLVSCTVRIQK